MSILWQRSILIGLCACVAVLLAPRAAAADPVRISVTFTVMGAAGQDPDFGSSTGSGSFSVIANLPRGEPVTRRNGFGADEVAFSFAGTTWDTSNADVVQLGLDSRGAVNLWALSGQVPGPGGTMQSNIFPDFGAGFCGFCPAQEFGYTTSRSPQLGIFTGRVTSFDVTTTPAKVPAPEPASLLLVGTGCVLVAARRGRRILRVRR